MVRRGDRNGPPMAFVVVVGLVAAVVVGVIIAWFG